MAKQTALDIIERTKQLVAAHRKQAESPISGEDVNSMPGAENNKPREVPPLDPNVKQRFPNEPSSARTNEGAGPDGTAKITQKQTLAANEAAPVSVAKEPLDTADANADRPSSKAAADLAAGLVADIRAHQKKKATTKKAADDAAEAKAEGEPEEQEKKENEENKEEKEEGDGEKEAGSDTIDMDQAVLAKIAAIVLSTKNGWEFAEGAIKKYAGAQAAAEVMNHVKTRTEQQDAEQSYKMGAAHAEQAVQNMLAEQLAQSHNQAYYKGYADAVKTAGVQAPAPMSVNAMQQAAAADYAAGQKIAEELIFKTAQDQYAQGQQLAEVVIQKFAQDVASLDDPQAQQALSQMATSPDAGGAPEAGAEGGDAAGVQEAAAGISDASPEEIGEALAELVQEGTVPAEEAMQIVDAIDAAAGGDEGGEPAAE